MTKFDATLPLVLDRGVTISNFAMVRGEPLQLVAEETPEIKGAVTQDVAERLWAGGIAVYAKDFRPTPVETPREQAEREVQVDDLGKGHSLVRAPWIKAERIEAGPQPIPEPEQEEEVVEPGLPVVPQDFVAEEDGSNGYYTITGPGLVEPLRVRGAKARDEKLEELRAARAAQDAKDPPGSATAEG